jgi:hypothetical protein
MTTHPAPTRQPPEPPAKKLRRNCGLYPELWRVKWYGIKENGDEGYFVSLVMAPHLEDVFAVVRKEHDDGAIFESVNHAVVHFADECWAEKQPRAEGIA